VKFLGTVFIGAGCEIVAGDGGIGGHDLRVGRREHLGLRACGPFHDEVSGCGAGAIADLLVIHHAPWAFDLFGEVEGGRRRGQGGRGVGSEQQSTRVVPRHVFTQLQLEGIDSGWVRLHGNALACVGGMSVELPYGHGGVFLSGNGDPENPRSG